MSTETEYIDGMDLEDFDLSTHNAHITLKNPSTGNHRTFAVRTEEWGDEKKRVVSIKQGASPIGYARFAFVSEEGLVHVWKKYRDTSFEKFAEMLQKPALCERSGVEYLVEGRCRRCNRLLTQPSSIKDGIGPVCKEKQSI